MRIAHLIIYVNNSLSNLDFNNWEFIDFENSDLDDKVSKKQANYY